MAVISHVVSLFEGNGYNQGLKIYLQSIEEVEKDPQNVEVSVSNEKYGGSFFGLANKYGLLCLSIREATSKRDENVFRRVQRWKYKDGNILELKRP